MEQNMTFTDIQFKGQVDMNGVPVFNHDGAPFSVGGYISDANTETAYFGRVVSATAAAPRTFLMGIAGEQKVVGILQNDYAIRENSPFKADYLLPLTPATVIFFGMLWMGSWTHAGAGTHTTPVRGDVVIFKDTTGQIEFLPVLTAIPAGYTMLDASVMDYDVDTNKVLIFMGISNAMSESGTTPEVLENTTFQVNNTGVAIPGIVLTGLFTTALSSSGTFNPVTGKAAELKGTVATPNYGDGYAFVESELTISGVVGGSIAAFSAWINIPTGTTGANMICSQTNGIYAEAASIMTGAMVIFGMRAQCLCQSESDIGSMYPFSIVNNTNITTALIQCNAASSDIGELTNAGVDSGKLVPLFKDGTKTGYVKIYTLLA